jgi:DNA-binding beta-propeller fold protein YncE
VRRCKHPETEKVCGVAVNPTGTWVATGCGGDGVYLWDFATGERLHKWKGGNGYWKTGRLAFHPSADLLAACGGHETVEVYNPTTRKVVATLDTEADAVRDVAFSPNGKWLAAAGDADKTVHVWEVGTWKKVASLTGAKDAYSALAFSPDSGTLACGSHDGDVYLWGTAQWARQAILSHGVRVHGVTFSPDGTRLACGCEDNTVRLWDTARREQVTELRGHNGYVHHLAFSPNGRRLVTASGDLTLRAWDAASPTGVRR